MPSTQKVIDYVNKHPGCKSKEIAAALGCPKQEINKRSGSYPGIYAIPEIKHEDFKHYPASAVLDEEQSCIYDIPDTADVDDCIIDSMQKQITRLELQDREHEAKIVAMRAEHEERIDGLEDKIHRLEEQVERLLASKVKPMLKPMLKPKQVSEASPVVE
jgi:BMFP domain-containing protein YqiC